MKSFTRHYDPKTFTQIGTTSYVPGTDIPKETEEYLPDTGDLKGVTFYDPTGKKTVHSTKILSEVYPYST